MNGSPSPSSSGVILPSRRSATGESAELGGEARNWPAAMPPMSQTETGSYLHHHLALAGHDDRLFSDDAVALRSPDQPWLPPARSTTSHCKPSSPRSRFRQPLLTSLPI